MDTTTALLALAAAPLAAAALWLLPPRACRAVSVARLRRRCARLRALCLTFDDGPGHTLTRPIMDLVESHGGRATFFMLGANATRHPDLVAEVRRRGHQIGSHSRHHLDAWTTSPWRAARDVASGVRDVESLTGARGPFRPPRGRMTLASFAHALIIRRPPVWWTLDSGDTHPSPPDPARLAHALDRDGGGVVLLHDFDRSRPDRAAFVLDSTRHALEWARRSGAQVCTHAALARGPLDHPHPCKKGPG